MFSNFLATKKIFVAAGELPIFGCMKDAPIIGKRVFGHLMQGYEIYEDLTKFTRFVIKVQQQ